ncbi:hypothetical protein [Algoriphagus sp. A40]|uniref:hypothetical protein n=1 Tax=Algoriphagus sp. A40 TaxID=1945863 RepID=UPI0009856B89|nr:hypothetical protein [Algoriphagus sp. A40]OOG68074.1 hypothetical protein B0E43_22560 [Algoriphagus sp. A40]
MEYLNKFLRLKHHLVLMLAILFLSSFASFDAEAQRIIELKSYLESQKFSSSDPFMDLLYGSNGIIEIRDGQLILPKAPSPKNIILSGSAVSILTEETPEFASVEFIQIKLGDGVSSFSLDFGVLPSLSALKYILVTSTEPISASQISQMLTGFEQTEILIFYQISRPG